jgi:hypothetical protein
MPPFIRRSLVLLLLALLVYGVFFALIQRRRMANGPWEVTFIVEKEAPALIVNQPKLGIADVRFVFRGGPATTNSSQAVRFDQSRPAPFDLPFGRCVFLDPLFLPGTVAIEAFGHQIQLMPRILTVDRVEHPWRSGEIITLLGTNQPSLAK